MRRALSFRPHAAVANGDHVYWDLLAPLTSKGYGASPEAQVIAGKFDRTEKFHCLGDRPAADLRNVMAANAHQAAFVFEPGSVALRACPRRLVRVFPLFRNLP